MSDLINPMQKQSTYAEGKLAFVDGKRRDYNPYKWRDRELASIWRNGWDQAKKDSAARDHNVTNIG